MATRQPKRPGRADVARNNGFTLLELLLATVLSVLLMVGVLAVVADMRMPDGSPVLASEPQREAPAGAAAVEAWVDVLRQDLQHATAVQTAGENELVLMTYSALDRISREQTHRPVFVQYRIEELEGRRWLVRRQAALDLLTNQHIQRDLVCCGVDRFSMLERVRSAYSAQTATSPSGNAVVPAPSTEREEPVGDKADSRTKSEADQAADVLQAEPDVEIVQGVEIDPSRTGVCINGLHFYWEYAPEWVRRRLAEKVRAAGGSAADTPGAKAVADRITEEPKPASPASSTPAASLLPGGLQSNDFIREWRLRVWTSDTEACVHDRVVTVLRGSTP
jgi:hypothetical protein